MVWISFVTWPIFFHSCMWKAFILYQSQLRTLGNRFSYLVYWETSVSLCVRLYENLPSCKINPMNLATSEPTLNYCHLYSFFNNNEYGFLRYIPFGWDWYPNPCYHCVGVFLLDLGTHSFLLLCLLQMIKISYLWRCIRKGVWLLRPIKPTHEISLVISILIFYWSKII